MGIFHHRGNGGVQVVIYLKMSCHLSMHAGARRKQTRAQFLAYHPTPAGRLVANRGTYPSHALILVTFCVTPVPVLLARIWAPPRAAFAARSPCPGDASTPITILDGVASKYAATLCRAVSTRARSHVTRVYVALAKYKWIVGAIVER